MLFNSLSFAVFLPVVFLCYWASADKYRWRILLLASYYFYMSWNPKYVCLILLVTVISFWAAKKMENCVDKTQKKLVLCLSATTSLCVLLFFKYFNFVSTSLMECLAIFSVKMDPFLVDVVLPVGISFYTFQALGYVIDVYKGRVKAEGNFGKYATYVSFFPQLVAGPIERTENLLPQIKAEHNFDYTKATYGLKLMAWGFFKKIVIADSLARYVQIVYDAPQNYEGFALLLASVFFTIQIYCDFSGYSDIAIGTAKLFGIDLMTNFKNPYFSRSIKEFWTRWHISLSTWFRDYLYIPLGGNREGKLRQYWNVLLTFLVSGLWHGANWTFVLWGGIHGVAQIAENVLCIKKLDRTIGIDILRTGLTLCFCTFAWIFFVAHSTTDAIYVVTHMFDGVSYFGEYIANGTRTIGFTKDARSMCIVPLLILVLYDFFSLRMDVIEYISQRNVLVRWVIYVVFVSLTALLAQKGVTTEFVYFQF